LRSSRQDYADHKDMAGEGKGEVEGQRKYMKYMERAGPKI